MRTDAELLAAVAEGDRGALRELYDRHANWLVARLSRRSADPGMVDEAVQDTFVNVWRRADSYRGDGEVGAWLWGIAIRRLIDLHRRRRPVPVSVHEGRTRTVVSAEDEVLVGLEHGDLPAALERLSPEMRAALQAVVLDGLTTREASRLLGVKPGTLKSRVSRAKAALREELT